MEKANQVLSAWAHIDGFVTGTVEAWEMFRDSDDTSGLSFTPDEGMSGYINFSTAAEIREKVGLCGDCEEFTDMHLDIAGMEHLLVPYKDTISAATTLKAEQQLRRVFECTAQYNDFTQVSLTVQKALMAFDEALNALKYDLPHEIRVKLMHLAYQGLMLKSLEVIQEFEIKFKPK